MQNAKINDKATEQERSRVSKAVDRVEQNISWILVGFGALLIANSAGWVQLPAIQFSTYQKLMGVVFGVFLIITIPINSKILDKVMSLPTNFIIVADITDRIMVRSYAIHPDLEERISLEGKAHSFTSGGSTFHIVREFNPAELHGEGVWMGEVSDVELMAKMDNIEANRGRLRTWAKIGQQLYSKIPVIASNIEDDYSREMADVDLEKQVNHPEVVENAIYEEIEELAQSMELPGEKDTEEVVEENLDEAHDEGRPEGGEEE